jgi:DnaJ-class molecular chaperone
LPKPLSLSSKPGLTPYAVLLVKPTDDDGGIRKRFHDLSRIYHPDANGGVPDERWHGAVVAYNAVKTAELRLELARRTHGTAGVCLQCDGCGVVWSRLKPRYPPRVCEKCDGRGRC